MSLAEGRQVAGAAFQELLPTKKMYYNMLKNVCYVTVKTIRTVFITQVAVMLPGYVFFEK